MKLGLWVPCFTWPGVPIGPRLAEIGKLAESVGFESIWLMDHFFQIPGVGDVNEPMLEAYTRPGLSGRGDLTRSPRDHGHWRHLSLSGRTRQAGHHARRALGWSCHLRR